MVTHVLLSEFLATAKHNMICRGGRGGGGRGDGGGKAVLSLRVLRSRAFVTVKLRVLVARGGLTIRLQRLLKRSIF